MRALPLRVDLSLPPEERWQAICGEEGFARVLNQVMTKLFTHYMTRKLDATPLGWIYYLIRLLTLGMIPPVGVAARSLVRSIVHLRGGPEAVTHPYHPLPNPAPHLPLTCPSPAPLLTLS